MKIKESEKTKKYLDLARELKKKMWNMQVTVIPIVVSVVGMVPKGLERGLEQLEIGRRIKTIHTTVLVRLARIF